MLHRTLSSNTDQSKTTEPPSGDLLSSSSSCFSGASILLLPPTHKMLSRRMVSFSKHPPRKKKSQTHLTRIAVKGGGRRRQHKRRGDTRRPRQDQCVQPSASEGKGAAGGAADEAGALSYRIIFFLCFELIDRVNYLLPTCTAFCLAPCWYLSTWRHLNLLFSCMDGFLPRKMAHDTDKTLAFAPNRKTERISKKFLLS